MNKGQLNPIYYLCYNSYFSECRMIILRRIRMLGEKAKSQKQLGNKQVLNSFIVTIIEGNSTSTS